jgi:hypothetical protein
MTTGAYYRMSESFEHPCHLYTTDIIRNGNGEALDFNATKIHENIFVCTDECVLCVEGTITIH